MKDTTMPDYQKWVERLAGFAAVLGGIVLCAIALMTTISIIGRAFLFIGLRPVPGDFELVEAGTAFAVCAFLPWCQLQRGHVSVSIVSDRFSAHINRVLDLLVDLLLLATALVLTWRHLLGLIDKQAYGETTFILQYPIWWAYAGCLFGLSIWIIIAIFMVVHDANALLKGQGPPPRGATS